MPNRSRVCRRICMMFFFFFLQFFFLQPLYRCVAGGKKTPSAVLVYLSGSLEAVATPLLGCYSTPPVTHLYNICHSFVKPVITAILNITPTFMIYFGHWIESPSHQPENIGISDNNPDRYEKCGKNSTGRVTKHWNVKA